MKLLQPVPGLCLAVAASVLGWMLLGRPVPLPDVPDGRFQCLSYTPSSDAGSPLDGRPGVGYPIPPGLIERDVALLRKFTDCLRIYSTAGRQADVIPVAAAAGMQVAVGAWLGAKAAENAIEIERAIELARTYPESVRTLIVGNEVLLRGEMSGPGLVREIRAVKAALMKGGLRTPVAYAEVVDYWLRHPEVADAVDLMFVHMLPYWDDTPSTSAADHQAKLASMVQRIREAFPGKPFEIGEAGWPSAGRSRGSAIPGRVNQALVVRSLAAGAAALRAPYNVIEAIDQPWKRAHEGTVGGSWGLLDANRLPKFPLHGPVSEWPNWRIAAGFSVAVSCAAFLAGAMTKPPIDWWRGLLLGFMAPAVGSAWVGLADQVRVGAFGVGGWIWGGWLFAVGVTGGVFLILCILDPRARGPDAPFIPAWPRPGGLAAPEPLSVFHWAVTVTATLAALLLAVDGRYREFPSLALGPSAAAFLLRFARAHGRRGHESRPRGGWCALTLAACGVCALADWRNREAWVWAACCLALAAPWLAYGWLDVRRMILAIRAPR